MLEDFDPDAFQDTQQDAMSRIGDFIRTRLERDIPILRIFPSMIESDSVMFPMVLMEYYVITDDGTIYRLNLVWPTMDVTNVFLCNQDS